MPDEPGETAPGGPSVPENSDTTSDQPTVAIPGGDETSGEGTTATPASVTSDEATVALPAAATTDETTATPDEATVTPDEATAKTDEATVATAEATVATEDATVATDKITPPADEATVALSASPAPPTDEATVAMPVSAVSDASSASPPAPAKPDEPPTTAPGRPVLTRRRVLIGLTGAAAASVAGAVAVHSATTGTDTTPARPVKARPAVTRPRVPESTTAAAPPTPVQHRPIYTLAEYRNATGAPAFPTDAIALTIDDGPHPVWTPKILHLLDKHHVPAVFCLIGNQVLGHEEVARTVTRAGHQLANHTWSHPTKLANRPQALVHKEIGKAQTKIKDITGYAPKLFRSPGGDWSPRVLQEVAQAGLMPLDWSNDPRDWSRPGAAKIEHRMLAARPGQILLCHDGGGDRSQTYHALSVVIPALKARGLRFVAL